MPSKMRTVWKAKPHTLAKIELLGDYLIRWFQILGISGISREKDLIYIDGFAGPGEYENHSKGSPLEALIAAKKARADSRTTWKAGTIHCVFIEENRKRFENLKARIEPFDSSPEVKIHLINDQFVAGLQSFGQAMPAVLNSYNPLFVFLDPFGAKGIPFATVKSILNNFYSEVLINLDADGIARIVRANEDGSHELLLNEIFGNDQWKTIPQKAPFSQQCQQVLSIYKTNLRLEASYVYSFEMRTSQKALNYYLVFASKHPRGLEKMKESMKKIDQDGSFRFVDTNVGQLIIFRDDQTISYAEQMHTFFLGQSVNYKVINDYALNETPFVNPKAMLKHLEENEKVVVSASAPRRRGTFNEEKILSIRFETGITNGN